ncbi:MAG: energy-coupling factor transporter transmembrane protein EcfT [Ruminococcaceae bacterium]|nr:energy-coupling factor transporter transmembrane protein EcfT [Oscillospiraceae bacterium]
MLKDITLGQYFPLDSCIHKLDPRVKILLTLFYIILIFFVHSVSGYLLVGFFTLFLIFLSKVPLKVVIKSVKPLLIIIFITAFINLFFTGGEKVVFSWKFIKITENGIINAVSMALRLVFLVMGSSLLTYTTSPILLTDGIERLLSPFSKIGLPSHELAMMMTIALRFIPTLLEETEKIIMAQKSRGADFESGNLLKRAKALVPVLVPLFISSFRRADELATAMECRCYRGGKGRTSLRQLKINSADVLSIVIFAIFCAVLVLINVYNIRIMGY